ncbi:Ctl protein, partial [Globisporangium splendens]
MELEHADDELLLEKPSRVGGNGVSNNSESDGYFGGGGRRIDYKDRVFALGFGANVAVVAAIALFWGLPNASSIYFTVHRDGPSGSSHGFNVFLILLSTSCIGAGVSALWLYVLQHHAAQVITWTLKSSIVVCIVAALVAFYDSGVGGRAIGFINLFLAFTVATYYGAVRPSIAFAASSLTTASRILQVFPALVTASYTALVALGVWTLVWSIAVVGILAKAVDHVHLHDSSSFGNTCFFFILLSFHWFVQVAKNVVHCVAAGAVGEWWFGSHDANTIQRSQTRALTTSLGSICFGSLVVAALNALETVLLSTQRRKSNSSANACLECLVSLVKRNLQYFNKFAFCQVALYGKDFRTAGSDTMRLFRDRGWSFLLNDSLIASVLGVGCLVVDYARWCLHPVYSGGIVIALCASRHSLWRGRLGVDVLDDAVHGSGTEGSSHAVRYVHTSAAESTAASTQAASLTIDVQRGGANICRVCIDRLLDVRDRVVHFGLDRVNDLRLLRRGPGGAAALQPTGVRAPRRRVGTLETRPPRVPHPSGVDEGRAVDNWKSENRFFVYGGLNHVGDWSNERKGERDDEDHKRSTRVLLFASFHGSGSSGCGRRWISATLFFPLRVKSRSFRVHLLVVCVWFGRECASLALGSLPEL